jgi:hypothetical protein
MTAVLDVIISGHATATVAREPIAKGRHRTLDEAMDRYMEIARARRKRVAEGATVANGREHSVWAYSGGKVYRMNEAEIRGLGTSDPITHYQRKATSRSQSHCGSCVGTWLHTFDGDLRSPLISDK